MKVARSVAEVLSQHTTLALECIDRLYLNVYVPVLQRAAGAAYFFRKMRGAAVPSSVLMAPITQRFVNAINRYAERNGIDVVSFRRGERKDDRTQEYLRQWTGDEGVLYIGKAQEKARVLRTERRHDPATGGTYAWLVSSTAMVNHFYFYAVDDDFGPFFLKFCSYFPYNAKLCINGHEYLKRQLTKRGIAFEPLDNGIRSCADPEAMQRLADGLTADKIDALLRCARLTGEGQPVEVRRKEGVTNHFRPESCAGRCEAAGEALTGARTGRAIEHRKRERLERRDCHSGRRQHRHHRNGEGMAGATVSENPCTFVRPSSGPGRSSFCPGSRTGAAAGRRIPYPMMHGMKKSDEAIVPVKAANKGAQTPAESPEGRASTKGNLRDQSTHRTQGRDGVSQAVERIRQAATPRGLPSTTQGRSRMR